MLPEETHVHLHQPFIPPNVYPYSLPYILRIGNHHSTPFYHKSHDKGYILPFPILPNNTLHNLKTTHSAVFWEDRIGCSILHPQLGLPFTLIHDRILRTIPKLLKDLPRAES